jgi:hypothetical protein
MKILLAVLFALLMVSPAEANGSKAPRKKVYRSAPAVVRVYEPVPRPAPPLVALSLAGSNLIIWDDLDVDLFDDGDPLPPRVLRMRAPDRRVRVQTFDRYSRRKGQGY